VGRLRDGLTVAGLTGSQGKTSTKDLLAAVLSSAAPTIATIGSFNNELGVPLTMLRADATTRYRLTRTQNQNHPPRPDAISKVLTTIRKNPRLRPH
jgi:UDP-N-acetylmuramyl pentapeptide synthase